MGKEFYFKTDDSLDRIKYAEFLKSLLENCDKYRREDSEGAYVIAIDSPWGTGKTRFAKMLRNYLEDRTREMGDDSRPGNNAVCNTIYYNSWETDFSNDALQPLIHSIVNSPEFKAEMFNTKGRKVLKTFKDSAVAVARVAGYAFIHNLAGETAAKAVQAIDDTISEEKFNPLKEYQDRLKVLEKFKKSLRDVIEQTEQKKLLIIVDELDRCRPTFAIETLELAKHLFDVDGLIFIFALDIKQLSCSVETVYGQEMDASGYLCRFFDYIGKLPIPNTHDYIQSKLMNTKFFETISENSIQQVSEFFNKVAITFKLSLRDIDTIFTAYYTMNLSFLSRYEDYAAHKLYIYLLSVKYKDIDLFNRLFGIIAKPPIRTEQLSKKYHVNQFGDYQEILEVIQSESMLCDCAYLLKETNGKILMKNAFIRGAGYVGIIGEGLYQIIFHNEDTKESITWFSDHGSRFTWGAVFFAEDILKWDAIKNMKASEYIYRQLEMFNFALPADEPAER